MIWFDKMNDSLCICRILFIHMYMEWDGMGKVENVFNPISSIVKSIVGRVINVIVCFVLLVIKLGFPYTRHVQLIRAHTF